MPVYLIQKSTLDDIGDAIRAKTGGSALIAPGDMPEAISGISGGIEAQFYTWDQRPPLVAAFLDNVTYDPSDYSTSQIANYAPAIDVTSNYKPVGHSVVSSAGTLNRNGYVITANNGTTIVYSDIPGRDTPFTVQNSSAVTQTGLLRPTGALRWINTPQAWNCRDLGGWACDGGTVKDGKMFRGGRIASADLDVLLNQLRIGAELDLRGATEAAQNPSPLEGKVEYTLFDDYAWYTLVNRSLWRKMLRVVFDCAALNKPLYMHCTAGADRTGTLCCIIEGLLGVSQSDIDKDYELTCFYSGTADDSRARRRNEAEWTGLIGEINALPGTSFLIKVVNFAAILGFTASEINAFRANMIDGTPGVVTPTVETYSVTRSLTNVTIDNTANAVVQGDPYEAELTPFEDYYIDSVTITMGNVDVSSYYSAGRINIPAVTGNIVITAIAEQGEQPIINLIDTIGIAANTRLSTSDGGNRTGATGYASIGATKDAVGMISIAPGDTIRIKGMTVPSAQDTMCALCFYSSDGTFSTSTYFQQSTTSFNGLRFTHGTVMEVTATSQIYFRLSLICADTTAVVVTRNQLIT